MGEKAERKAFQAEGQAGIGGGMRAAVLRSGAEGKRGVEPEQKPPLSGRGKTPASDDSDGGTDGMARAGGAVHWRREMERVKRLELSESGAKGRGRDTRTLFEGEGEKRFGIAARHTFCLTVMKIR